MVTTSDSRETPGGAASAVGSQSNRTARPRRANPTTASSSRRCLLRVVLCLIAGSTGLFWCVGRAGAQTQATPVAGVPSTDVPSALETPEPATPASDFADIIDAAVAEDATGLRTPSRHTASQFLGGGEMGLLGMIRESMFGNQRDPWNEMPPSTFFSEGWLRALVLLSPQHHGRPPPGLDQRV